MDIQQALVVIALTIVAVGTILAIAARVILKKFENAPDKETVQNMITVATLQLEQKVHNEIQTTRHDLRHEMNGLMMPLSIKLEECTKQVVQLLILCGQIQSAMNYRMDHFKREDEK